MMTVKDRYVCERLGWRFRERASDDDNSFELCHYSPAGEDFSVLVNSEHFAEDVMKCAASFDVEKHVLKWLEAKKNGAKGIPSLLELVDDAQEIQKMLKDLADALKKFHLAPITVHVGYAFGAEESSLNQENALAANALQELYSVLVISDVDFKTKSDEEIAYIASQYSVIVICSADILGNRYKIYKKADLKDLEVLLLAGANLKYGFCRSGIGEYLVFTNPA